MALMAPSRKLRLALVLDALVSLTETSPGPVRILDAGSGDGLLAMSIARRHPEWKLTGWDLREDLLAGARQRAAGRKLSNVVFERVDLEAPLPDAVFDVILAIECLTEIPGDRRALEQLVHRLAPGGWLLAHVPERDWRPILPGSSPIWRHEVRHGYTEPDMRKIFEQLNLVDVEVAPTFRGTATLAQEVRDRIKGGPLPIRMLLFPLMVTAVGLERAGLTWGPSRALFTRGRRSAAG